jgi:hypothetical protein
MKEGSISQSEEELTFSLLFLELDVPELDGCEGGDRLRSTDLAKKAHNAYFFALPLLGFIQRLTASCSF